jgi:hypothetical protein
MDLLGGFLLARNIAAPLANGVAAQRRKAPAPRAWALLEIEDAGVQTVLRGQFDEAAPVFPVESEQTANARLAADIDQ